MPGTELHHTTFNGDSWSTPQPVEGRLTTHPPGLAGFSPGEGEALYCAFTDKARHLAWTRTADEAEWETTRTDDDATASSDGNFALAAYPLSDGEPGLYAVYCDDGGTWQRLTSDDGLTWSDPKKFTGLQPPAYRIAAAVYRDKLIVASTTADGGHLQAAVFDGTTWKPMKGLEPFIGDAYSVSLAVFNEKLYCVRGASGSSETMLTTFYDGTDWSADRKFTPPGGISAPSIGLIQENQLVCVYSDDDRHLRYALSEDGEYWDAPVLLHQGGKATGTAALLHFKTKLHCLYPA
ncbi:sialidase family protein [Streptomyces cyaneofuscatus]|uniref:sialidase family protein n=1 Tax=Streptomyces cyaneofuscatus TaxID=66883 RepID=UPI0033215D78